MNILPVLGIVLTTGSTPFLTYNFQKDVDKLANCSLLENLWSRREEFKNFSDPYHNRLMRVLVPWYKENCK